MAESLGDELKEVAQEQQPAGREQGLADSLIRLNQLSYRLPSNLSVTVSRNMKRSFADKNTYNANGKIIITWNTGTDYVDGINSYLTFKVAVNAGASEFVSGSAVNIIENITVTSRSGREIERQEGVNNLRRDMDRYMCSQDWIENFGSVMGYSPDGSPIEINTTAKQFCIPLNRLVGCCNVRKLMPSQLAGGLRFEIKLASLNSAFKEKTAAPTDYTVSDVSMMLDTYHLADSIQKKLNMMASRQGLEYFYETHDRTRFNITSSNKANIVVRKAVSRALWAIAKTRLTANVENKTEDGVASETNAVDNFQWRLGSLYFPNQPLDNKEEQYYYAQYAFDKVKHCHKQNSVSLSDFKGTEGLVAATLSRSQILGLAGLPLNNSRQLEVEINYGSPASRTIDVYVAYLKVAKVFINNVVVRE